MSRRTRNSLDAANFLQSSSSTAQDPEASRSPSSLSLSASDRQDLIRDVVQAVLAATGSSPASTSGPSVPSTSGSLFASAQVPSPSTVSSPGMCTGSLVPSFVNTYTIPSNSSCVASSISSPLAIVSSTATPPTSTFSALPSCLPLVAPILHQPFVVGPGVSPVPAKLVTQIAVNLSS